MRPNPHTHMTTRHDHVLSLEDVRISVRQALYSVPVNHPEEILVEHPKAITQDLQRVDELNRGTPDM